MGIQSASSSTASALAFVMAVFAVIVALFASGVAMAVRVGAEPVAAAVPVDVGGHAAAGATVAVGARASVAVVLSEYSIDSSPPVIPVGAVLTVTNDGQIPHNLTVRGEDLATGSTVSSTRS